MKENSTKVSPPEAARTDYRFAYMAGLVRSVEEYTTSRTRRERNAFMYRGADLSRAVEKHLYFELVNRDDLRGIFAAARRGESYELPRGEADSTREILEDMIAEPDEIPAPPVGTGPSFFRRCLNVLRRQTIRVKARLDIGGRKRVLAVVHNPRFMEFVRPFLEMLPVGYRGAYLVYADADLRDSLVEKALPFVDYSGLGSWTASYRYAAERGLVEKQSSPALDPFRVITKLFDHLFETLKDMRPHSLVLLVAEGNSPRDEITARVAKLLGIRTVCVQNGWSPIFHNGFRGNSYSRKLTWGPGFDEWFRKHNPGQEYIATGNPAAESFETSEEKKRCVAFFLQPISPLISREHLMEFTDLIAATAREHPDAAILVRDHPTKGLPEKRKQELLASENIRFMSAPDFAVADLMRPAVCAVTMYSSTILECIQANVIPIIFNPTSLPAYNPDPEGAAVETKSSDIALKSIQRSLRDEGYQREMRTAMSAFSRKYMTPADGRTPHRIRNAIIY